MKCSALQILKMGFNLRVFPSNVILDLFRFILFIDVYNILHFVIYYGQILVLFILL